MRNDNPWKEYHTISLDIYFVYFPIDPRDIMIYSTIHVTKIFPPLLSTPCWGINIYPSLKTPNPDSTPYLKEA